MQVLTAPASFGHSDCERIVVDALAQPVLAVTSLAYVVAGIAVLVWAVRVRSPLAGAAGVALVAVGAGSFAYHGPQPSWAKLAHDWPIIAAGAVYAAGLARSGRRQRWSAWAAPAAVFALGLAAYAAGRSGSPLCRPDSLWQYHGAWHILSAAAAGWATRAMAPGRRRRSITADSQRRRGAGQHPTRCGQRAGNGTTASIAKIEGTDRESADITTGLDVAVSDRSGCLRSSKPLFRNAVQFCWGLVDDACASNMRQNLTILSERRYER